MGALQRHQNLLFQRVLRRIGPGQRREIGGIAQRHHIAPSGHAAHAAGFNTTVVYGL